MFGRVTVSRDRRPTDDSLFDDVPRRVGRADIPGRMPNRISGMISVTIVRRQCLTNPLTLQLPMDLLESLILIAAWEGAIPSATAS